MKTKMEISCGVSQLVASCKDFCRQLEGGFVFSLSIDKFYFCLDTRRSQPQGPLRKNASPSKIRRDLERRRCFLERREKTRTQESWAAVADRGRVNQERRMEEEKKLVERRMEEEKKLVEKRVEKEKKEEMKRKDGEEKKEDMAKGVDIVARILVPVPSRGKSPSRVAACKEPPVMSSRDRKWLESQKKRGQEVENKENNEKEQGSSALDKLKDNSRGNCKVCKEGRRTTGPYCDYCFYTRMK